MLRRGAFLVSLFVAGLVGCGAGDPESPVAEVLEPPVPARLDKMDSDLRALIVLRSDRVREDPTDASRWGNLGLVYASHELFAPALECFGHAVDSSPEDARWQYHLAQMQRKTGRVEAALVTYAEVARLEPEYAPAHWRQGFLLLEQGRIDEAEQAFSAAQAIVGSQPAAAGLARVALARERPREVLEVLRPYLADGTAQAYLQHLAGVAYRQLGRMDLAETALMKGRDSTPRWQDLWGNETLLNRVEHYTRLEQALVWFESGRPAQAIPTLENLLVGKPGDRRTLAALGRAYLLAGKNEAGLTTLRRMVELHPEHPESWLNLAKAYEHFNDLPRALEYVDRSIAIDPNYSASHRRRGIILVKLGRLDPAGEALARAVALAPDSVQAWNALGECRLRMADWAAAATAFKRVVHLEPDRTATYSRLGLALLRSGDSAGATAAFSRAQSSRQPSARSR